MLNKMRFAAFVLTFVAGSLSSTFFSYVAQPAVKGFSREEAQAKLGRRVKLKADTLSIEPTIVNHGVVAYIDQYRGQRVLVIDWDEKLPGWKHRITEIDRKTYQETILEE